MIELAGYLDESEIWRLVHMTKWVALKVDFERDLENIELFISEGRTVILTTDLDETLFDLDLTREDITIVESEEEEYERPDRSA